MSYIPGENENDQFLARRSSHASTPHAGGPDSVDENGEKTIPNRPSGWSSIKLAIELLKILALPMVAIAYLAFCYTVHYRVVPVTTSSSVDDPRHLGA